MIAGHDWGAPVAWHAALLRPDRFRAVIGLSVPYRPRGAVRPTAAMPQTEEAIFYQLYFQSPGVAEAELERDVRATMRLLAYSGSGNAPERGNVAMVRRGGGFLDQTTDPDTLPPWLTAADIDFYTPGMDQLIANLSTFVPRLRRTVMLPGCGHWTQQERASEVNAAMLEFLKGV